MYIMLSIIQANFDYLNYAQAIVATRTLIRAVKTSLSNVISHTVPLQSSAQRPQVAKLSLVPSLPPWGVRLGHSGLDSRGTCGWLVDSCFVLEKGGGGLGAGSFVGFW